MSSITDKVKQFVGTVAPTLATALGGPLAGMAVAEIEKVFGVKPDDSKAMDAAMANATPDQLLALKNADQAFVAKMKELDIDEDKLVFDDRANARAREIATKDKTPMILAFLVVLATMVLEGLMLILGQPKSVDPVIIGRVLGTFDSATLVVLGYYFGTTLGSKDKDVTIAAIAKGP